MKFIVKHYPIEFRKLKVIDKKTDERLPRESSQAATLPDKRWIEESGNVPTFNTEPSFRRLIHYFSNRLLILLSSARHWHSTVSGTRLFLDLRMLMLSFQ